MRGTYVASTTFSSLTTGPQTLIQLTAPSTAVVELIRATVTVNNNATNEQLEIQIQRASVAGGSPTGLTPAKTEDGDQAAGSTVGASPTSEPTYTANKIIDRAGIPSVGGYVYNPVPEERPIIAPSAIVGLKINTPSFTSSSGDATLTFREIG